MTYLTDLRKDEGATAVEYGIMVALIAVVIIAIVAALGGSLRDTFTGVNQCLEAENPGPDCAQVGGEGTDPDGEGDPPAED